MLLNLTLVTPNSYSVLMFLYMGMVILALPVSWVGYEDKKGNICKRIPINVPDVFILFDSVFYFKFIFRDSEGGRKRGKH